MKSREVVKPTCPDCGRAHAFEKYEHATMVYIRKCQCGVRWAVKVRPMEVNSDQLTIHQVEWVFVERYRND